MIKKYPDTRYYVLDKNHRDDFYGCPIKYFMSSEEAIGYADALFQTGRPAYVEEVTWLNATHRSHSIIYDREKVEPDMLA